jgi:hypothetical protein
MSDTRDAWERATAHPVPPHSDDLDYIGPPPRRRRRLRDRIDVNVAWLYGRWLGWRARPRRRRP